MKTRQVVLSVLIILSFSFLTNAQISDNLSGSWHFDAPDAPEGSTSGDATFKADTVILIFEGHMKFPSDWVKAGNDSITFQVSFESDKVRFSLLIRDDQTLDGKAVWENGETPIIFRRKKI